jgi:hypothetical protein
MPCRACTGLSSCSRSSRSSTTAPSCSGSAARHAPANPRKVSSDEPPVPFSNRLVVITRQFDVLQAVYAKALAALKVSGSYGTSPNLVNSGEIKR